MCGEDARRVSERRIVPSENTRHRHERRYGEQEGKKSPQNGAWHRCKDSISGGSPLLPANGSRATLDFRATTSSRHPPRPACRPAGRSECVRLEFGACDNRRPADWRPACGEDGCSSAVHACRGIVAWQRASGFADTLDQRPLERLATCGARSRRRPRRWIARAATCRLAPRESVLGWAVGSSRGTRGRERDTSPSAARVEPRGSHPAPRSDLDRNAADHAAALLGGR